MVETQREIFANAMRLLKPGGAMLYATCSLEPEENRLLVEAACESGQFEVERVRQEPPRGQPGGRVEGYFDGAFSALLVQVPPGSKGKRSKRGTGASPVKRGRN
jgi:16S rRNA (cytosine967-C5)-methyltransferase